MEIPMSPHTQRFYQGVAVGSKVREAHADLPFPDHQSRLALYYFYAGALAASEHGCSTNEDFEPFLLGLATRAPGEEEDQGVEGETCEWFALCDRPATGRMSHPVLGTVPICDRCRQKVEALR